MKANPRWFCPCWETPMDHRDTGQPPLGSLLPEAISAPDTAGAR